MTRKPEQWRLLVTPDCHGAYNMALDHAILQHVGAGEAPPTLRLFSWNPACLSLGQAQHASDVDLTRIQEHGWVIVRRPTGGKAILHTDEITYSVALPRDHALVGGDIVTSYRRLSDALVVALERLGLADMQADKQLEKIPEAAKGPVCFEVPSDYEITADGKKLIGSAQVRKYGGVLQHGSVPLGGDIARICDALAFRDDALREKVKVRVRRRATTLEAVLGRAVSWDESAEALITAFADTFNLTLAAPEAPTPAEEAYAQELVAAQYGTLEWTQRL
ncbi:biotin/lipoate A/B protein ligase family protein [Chloroflexota bacterium]